MRNGSKIWTVLLLALGAWLAGCEAGAVQDNAQADLFADGGLSDKAGRCDGKCSPSCPCDEGDGDCDKNEDCAPGLVCPPDKPGIERCERGSGGGGGGDCDGKCSPDCRCDVGEGDCDRNEDCADGLACPADKPGIERCEPAAGGGGGGEDCDGKCSAKCRCDVGEGDCDRNEDCEEGLVCPPDKPGAEFCEKPGSGDSSCDGQCSPSCPCDEGEGDCDRNEDCEEGLVCPPNQPGTEFCEKPGSGGGGDDGGSTGSRGDSNLQVKLGGKWRGVCCSGGELEVSDGSCKWTESGRVLETRDLRTGNRTALDCPENGQRPKDCDCSGSGERMHGVRENGNVHVKNSLRKSNGAPIFPNSGHETCIDQVGGELQSRWTTNDCPDWRLVNFY